MKRQLKRSIIALVGSLLLVAGIIMIPYPGPGWLVVFAALGILATEFDWADRLLNYARGKYDGWTKWVANQGFAIKSAVWLGTALVVVMTIWLVNGYGLLNDWFNLHQDWVRSPII